ncbi:MAG: cytochrome c biogenesis protein CcdA [Hyphomicrobiales bacterium]|nr:cytochrome c biogenesis protein CcdA [Hyphomicrobiales bacterium]
MPEIAGIGVLTAFLAGIVSFLSPCVLPLVPGYVSYVAGHSLDELREAQAMRQRIAVLGLSSAFVLGFSSVFVSLGASASAIGNLFQAYRFEASYAAGAVIILFGLHMTGLLRLNWMNREARFMPQVPGGRPFGAFLLGSAFAFGWTPCIGPILGAILTLSATSMGVSDGAALLSIYSLGLAVPFLLVAAFTSRFMANAERLRRIGRPLQIAAGGILMLVGALMLTGYLFSFGTWMLNTFPFFQDIQI